MECPLQTSYSRESESYQQIKLQSQLREGYAQQQADRKRNLVVLVEAFLRSEGYAGALTALESESNVSLCRVEPCDNVDLVSVLCEYEEYYKFKFNRPVKLTRRVAEGASRQQSTPRRAGEAQPVLPRLPGQKKPDSLQKAQDSLQKAAPAAPAAQAEAKPETKDQELPGIPVSSVRDKDVRRAGGRPERPDRQVTITPEGVEEEGFRPVLAAPPAGFPPELLGFYQIIQREILTEHPVENFRQVVGLSGPKQILRESVILPQKYPGLFTGILRPWKGCLLFSSPGNGKSLLARALAAECRCTFFNISASSILSKYYGESEKLVRCLFLMARQYPRAVIFIDELDCIMGARAEDSEHEASRRIKTQLLVELDGLTSAQHTPHEHSQVFVLAATNLPWTIDPAMLRRLEKRIYVPSPGDAERKQIVLNLLGDRLPPGQQGVHIVDTLTATSEHWSASDVCALCKETAMARLRKVLQQLEELDSLGSKPDETKVSLEVSMDEVGEAQKAVHPSYDLELQKKYEAWAKEFGA